MRVLVTGGTGFVGCHTVNTLRKHGHEVHLLLRSPQKIATALGPFGIDDIEHTVGDVTDRYAVDRALRGCDAVIHAAALFTMDRRREAEVHESNVVGSRNVLDRAVHLGLDPIVYVSSVSALFPPDGDELTHDASVKNPVDMYAASKAAAERYARSLEDGGAPIVCVYPGSIWGPNDPTLCDGVRTIIDLMKLGFLPATTGGMPTTDVRDLAELHALLLEPGLGPRRYMAPSHFLAGIELPALLARLTGRRIVSPKLPGSLMRGLGHLVDAVHHRTGRLIGPSHEGMVTLTRGVPCDDSRTVEEFGLRARSPEQTFGDALRWMREQGIVEPRHVGQL